MKKWGVQGLKNLTQIKLLKWQVKDSTPLYNTPKTVLFPTLLSQLLQNHTKMAQLLWI